MIKNNDLENIIDEIILYGKLNKLKNNKVKYVKQVINIIFNKNREYYIALNKLFDTTFSIKEVNKEFLDQGGEEILNNIIDTLKDEIIPTYNKLIERDLIFELMSFIIINHIKEFEDLFIYKYDEFTNDYKNISLIVSEAQENTIININKKEDIDYFDLLIKELNESILENLK